MRTKLIMAVALLATFANAQFFTNALASQLKHEQQKTTETARTDNAESQAVTIDFENDHAELVNYPQPKGCELLVFASKEPLVLTQ